MPVFHFNLKSVFALDRASSPRLEPAASGESIALLLLVNIDAADQGDFAGVDAIARNRIFELRVTEPGFLMEFKDRLKRRRWVEPGV